MRLPALRVLLVMVLTAGFIGFGASGAMADYWGAYKWSGPDAYPGFCLAADVNISTSSSPDLHNVAAADSCSTGLDVAADLYEYNSSNQLIAFETSGHLFLYAHAGVQHVTGSGDYWVWYVHIYASDGTQYTESCSNKGIAYSNCYNSAD